MKCTTFLSLKLDNFNKCFKIVLRFYYSTCALWWISISDLGLPLGRSRGLSRTESCPNPLILWWIDICWISGACGQCIRWTGILPQSHHCHLMTGSVDDISLRIEQNANYGLWVKVDELMYRLTYHWLQLYIRWPGMRQMSVQMWEDKPACSKEPTSLNSEETCEGICACTYKR